MPEAIKRNPCLSCGQELNSRAVRCIYCMKEVPSKPGSEGGSGSRQRAILIFSVLTMIVGGASVYHELTGSANLQNANSAKRAYSLKVLDKKLREDTDKGSEESQSDSADPQLTEAIGEWTKRIEMHPKDAEAYLERGWSYNELQQYDNAIYDLSRAIKLNPKSALAYSRRAWVHDTRGEYQKAVVDATRAIRLNAKCSEAYQARACAYASLGDSKKAQADSAASDRLASAGSR